MIWIAFLFFSQLQITRELLHFLGQNIIVIRMDCDVDGLTLKFIHCPDWMHMRLLLVHFFKAMLSVIYSRFALIHMCRASRAYISIDVINTLLNTEQTEHLWMHINNIFCHIVFYFSFQIGIIVFPLFFPRY